MMIPQIEPWIDDEELKQLEEVIKSTFITEHKKTEEFERKFSEITNSKYSLAYCNGTMSLFAALRILNIGKDDEVIVPDLTFIASANSVILAGAKPVFADIDRKTFQISPEEIEKNISEKTRAIMPVHLYGQSCDMDKIMKIAMSNNLKIVEDAAQGFGVKFNGKHVGTFGEFGSFSFYGNKIITTGEGGMLVTENEELAKKAFSFKNHGRAQKGKFIHDEIGFNFSITDIHAAIGLAQLSKFNRIKKRKENIFKYYKKELGSINEIEFPALDERCEPIYWFTNILVPDPAALQEFLLSDNIQTRRFFYPLHLQPCYKDMKIKGNFSNTRYAYEHGLSLPSSVILTDNQLLQVADKIKEFYTNKK